MNAEPTIDTDGAWVSVRNHLVGDTSGAITIDSSGFWHCNRALSDAATQLLDLYAPLLAKNKTSGLVVAHLGQTLDGFISTTSGASHYVTGPENIIHLHRMRALSDAVLVGANTVYIDDPKLTTRLVTGDNPVRVVIDPERRLQQTHTLFTDPSAQTLVLCTPNAANKGGCVRPHVEIVLVPSKTRHLNASACIEALHARGLNRLFIEGGGDTVTRFVKADVVDRLQITVAPVLFGAGQPGLRLASTTTPDQAFRPQCRQIRLGNDILFDCQLS